MAEELKLPTNLPKDIAEFMSSQKYANGMCIRNVNNLAATIANNAAITDEVFADILSKTNKTSMETLPDIYAVRNEINARYGDGKGAAPAPAAAAPTPAPTPEPEAAPAPTPEPAAAPAPLLEGFGAPPTSTPTPTPEPEVAPAAAPAPKKLSAAGNNPVVSSAAAAPPVDDIAAAFAAAPTAVTAQLETAVDEIMDELPEPPAAEEEGPVIDTEAETVTSAPTPKPETPAPSATTTEEAPKPIKAGGRGAKVVAAGPENVVKQLLDKIDERDKRIEELEKALTEASASSMKLSASIAKRLEAVGVSVE
jgi:hypothetical protein